MRVDIALRPGEEIIRDFTISPRLFWILIIVGVALIFVIPVLLVAVLELLAVEINGAWASGATGIGVVIGGWIVLYAFYLRSARHYLLTNQRAIETIGVLSKRTLNVEYEDITDIRVSQDAFERFVLNTGRVALNTAGNDKEEIVYDRVDHPYDLSHKVHELCDRRLREMPSGRATPTAPVISAPTTQPIQPPMK